LIFRSKLFIINSRYAKVTVMSFRTCFWIWICCIFRCWNEL